MFGDMLLLPVARLARPLLMTCFVVMLCLPLTERFPHFPKVGPFYFKCGPYVLQPPRSLIFAANNHDGAARVDVQVPGAVKHIRGSALLGRTCEELPFATCGCFGKPPVPFNMPKEPNHVEVSPVRHLRHQFVSQAGKEMVCVQPMPANQF